jgi:hypothetical protein
MFLDSFLGRRSTILTYLDCTLADVVQGGADKGSLCGGGAFIGALKAWRICHLL